MIVPVLTALLNKGDLIDARNLEALEMRPQLLGRTNAARRTSLWKLGASLLVGRPNIGAAWLVLPKDVMVRQRIAKNLKPSSPRRFASSASACTENPVTMAILAFTA